jgi:hypothetical protein
MAPRDPIAARAVLGQRAPAEQLGELVAQASP